MPEPNTDQQQQQTNQPQTVDEKPWYSDEHKSYVETKGWKTPADVITSVQNLEKLVGMDRAGRAIYRPKDENDAEGIKAFRAALGVPEKPEDYNLPVVEGGSPELVGQVASLLHKHGIPAEAGRALLKDYYELEKSWAARDAESMQAAFQKELGELKTEWGGKYEANKEIADRAFKAFGTEAGLTDLERDAIIDAVGLGKAAKLFHAIGTRLGEAGTVDGQQGTGFSNKAAIQQQIDDLRQKRLENKIDQKGFLAEIERLGKMLDAAA